MAIFSSGLIEFFLAANRCANLAARQSDSDVASYFHLIGGAQHPAGCVVHDGVAAFEELEGAALLKAKRGRFEAPPPRDQQSVHARVHFREALFACAPKPAYSRSQIERREAHLGCSEAAAFLRYQALQRGVQSGAVLLDAAPQHGGARAQIER